MRIAPDGIAGIVTQQRSAAFPGRGQRGQSRICEGTLPNGLAFARNGDFLISNFGTDCLELMTRDGRSRVLADTIDGAADRQGQFRAARFEGPPLGHRLDPRSRTGCTRCAPISTTATSRCYEHGAFPHRRGRLRVHQRSPVRRRTKSFSMWSRPPAAASRRLRVDENGECGGPRGLRASQSGQGRMAGWHRVRQLRQSLGHHGLLGQALRPDARGRSAGSAR